MILEVGFHGPVYVFCTAGHAFGHVMIFMMEISYSDFESALLGFTLPRLVNVT
jgi:hypothetical protein